jgi:hypothetical protein
MGTALVAYRRVLATTSRCSICAAREPSEFRMLPSGHYHAHISGFDPPGVTARDLYVARLVALSARLRLVGER